MNIIWQHIKANTKESASSLSIHLCLKDCSCKVHLLAHTQQTMEQGWLHCKDPYLSWNMEQHQIEDHLNCETIWCLWPSSGKYVLVQVFPKGKREMLNLFVASCEISQGKIHLKTWCRRIKKLQREEWKATYLLIGIKQSLSLLLQLQVSKPGDSFSKNSLTKFRLKDLYINYSPYCKSLEICWVWHINS